MDGVPGISLRSPTCIHKLSELLSYQKTRLEETTTILSLAFPEVKNQ
jgi:hypothetical protein